MSWNIYMYAEVKSSNSEWKPLCEKCICDNFKHLDDNFVIKLPTMSARDSVVPAVKQLADGSLSPDFKVKYCTLDELRDYSNSIINKFNTQITAVYLALGMKIDTDEWYDVAEEDNCTCDIFDKMTFPINKDLTRDLLTYIWLLQKAYQVLGICNVLSSMCDNYNDQIKLIFATL